MSPTTSTLRPPEQREPETTARRTAPSAALDSGFRAFHPGGAPKPQVGKYSLLLRILIWTGLTGLSWGVVAAIGYGLYQAVQALLS